MTAYKTKPISDVTQCLIDYRGKTPAKSKSGVKLITAKVIKDGFIVDGDHEYISSDEYDAWMRRGLPRQWDVLITTEAPLGEVAQLRSPEKVALAQRVILLRGDPSIIHQSYFFQALKSPLVQAGLRARSTGTTVLGIKQSELRQVEIPCPPLPVQEAIASILCPYDDLIENNARRIKILDDMAQMTYRQWFVNFRFPGYEEAMKVESEMGLIPDCWQVSCLGEVTTKIGSGATPRGGRESYQTTGISLIRSLNVYNYRFEMDDLAFINDEQAQRLDNVTVEPDDVLLNITGASVGRCAMVPSYILPARVNQHVAIIRADPTKVDPFFLLDTINYDRNKQKLLGIAQGGATREALTKETIIEFPILLPPFDLIRRYGQIAGQLHQQRERLSRKNEILRATRDLLLPRLISGQISVGVAEKEAVAQGA